MQDRVVQVEQATRFFKGLDRFRRQWQS
jgi:hypothetical protein